jgi:hypothetical protein
VDFFFESLGRFAVGSVHFTEENVVNDNENLLKVLCKNFHGLKLTKLCQRENKRLHNFKGNRKSCGKKTDKTSVAELYRVLRKKYLKFLTMFSVFSQMLKFFLLFWNRFENQKKIFLRFFSRFLTKYEKKHRVENGKYKVCFKFFCECSVKSSK